MQNKGSCISTSLLPNALSTKSPLFSQPALSPSLLVCCRLQFYFSTHSFGLLLSITGNPITTSQGSNFSKMLELGGKSSHQTEVLQYGT